MRFVVEAVVAVMAVVEAYGRTEAEFEVTVRVPVAVRLPLNVVSGVCSASGRFVILLKPKRLVSLPAVVNTEFTRVRNLPTGT